MQEGKVKSKTLVRKEKIETSVTRQQKKAWGKISLLCADDLMLIVRIRFGMLFIYSISYVLKLVRVKYIG